MAEALWLFDMDGTVIDVNSFPLWVRQMLRGHLANMGVAARLSVSVRCSAAILERKLLRGSHHGFRRRLQHLWGQIQAAAPQGTADGLTQELLTHVRPNLQLLLQDITAGRADAILTTAAAAEYTLPFAHRLGFEHVIATPAAGGHDDIDNVGEVKCQRTLSYIAAHGWSARPRILFTDHCDDLPLIRQATALVWFGSYKEYLQVSRLIEGIPALVANDINPHTAYAWVLQQARNRSHACT